MPALRLHRLLIASDAASPLSEVAIDHAAYLASQHGAELHVLRIRPEPTSDLLEPLDTLQITEADLAEQLDVPLPNQESRAIEAPVPTTEVERVSDDAAAVILDYAQEHDIHLVVLSSRGSQGARRDWRPSVTEDVVRHAPCPVLTVAPGTEGVGPIRRVLAPVDGSEPSREAARHAYALAALYGADLHLLHIIDEVLLRPAYVPLIGGFQVDADEVKHQAEAWVQELAETLAGPDGPPPRVHVRIGHPALGVLDFARDEAMDLIVLGSHGRSGIERLLLGSVAERVIREAPCPVFTVKTFGRPLLAPVALDTAESAPLRTA